MFSIEEIELLTQGLDAMEKATTMGDVIGDLFVGIVARDEEQRRKLEEEQAARRLKKADAVHLQKMQINVLKGKLAQIALDIHSEAPFKIVSTT